MEHSSQLVDYRVRPPLTEASLASVTNVLASWLPSHADGSELASWGDEEWLGAEWVAYWQNAIPWLVARMCETGVEASEVVSTRLQILDRDMRERTLRLLANAVELLAALHDEGVEAIPLKGAVLAACYYRDPLMRPLTDLDILVKESDLGKAGEVLLRLAYRCHSRSAEDMVYVRGKWQGHGWSPDNIHPVEMHFIVREEYAGLEFDVSEMIWDSSSLADYWQGTQALLPDTWSLMLHACAHTSSDWLIRRGRLYQIGDIQILAAQMGQDEWAALDAHIGPADARYVYPALAFAQKYAPARQ